jgi:hypothetical protein
MLKHNNNIHLIELDIVELDILFNKLSSNLLYIYIYIY